MVSQLLEQLLGPRREVVRGCIGRGTLAIEVSYSGNLLL
jgi:hypothetical protein